MKDNIRFEEELNTLKELADKIKQPNVSLEDSIRFYEEGMASYKKCSEILDNAKQKIESYDFNTGETKEF